MCHPLHFIHLVEKLTSSTRLYFDNGPYTYTVQRLGPDEFVLKHYHFDYCMGHPSTQKSAPMPFHILVQTFELMGGFKRFEHLRIIS